MTHLPPPAPPPVFFSRTDREIGTLLLSGAPPKAVAEELELSLPTVHSHILRMCRRAEVADRCALVLWMLQNPGCLKRGGESAPGLHPLQCDCGSPYCSAVVQLSA